MEKSQKIHDFAFSISSELHDIFGQEMDFVIHYRPSNQKHWVASYLSNCPPAALVEWTEDYLIHLKSTIEKENGANERERTCEANPGDSGIPE